MTSPDQVLDLLPLDGSTVSGGSIKERFALRDGEWKDLKKQIKDEGWAVFGRGRGGTIRRKLSDEQEAELAITGTGKSSGITESQWNTILKKKAFFNCQCEIDRSMTLEELNAMEEGCTKGSGLSGGWVCPVLDYFRRMYD